MVALHDPIRSLQEAAVVAQVQLVLMVQLQDKQVQEVMANRILFLRVIPEVQSLVEAAAVLRILEVVQDVEVQVVEVTLVIQLVAQDVRQRQDVQELMV